MILLFNWGDFWVPAVFCRGVSNVQKLARHGVAGFLVGQVRFAVQKGEGQLEWQVSSSVQYTYT